MEPEDLTARLAKASEDFGTGVKLVMRRIEALERAGDLAAADRLYRALDEHVASTARAVAGITGTKEGV